MARQLAKGQSEGQGDTGRGVGYGEKGLHLPLQQSISLSCAAPKETTDLGID